MGCCKCEEYMWDDPQPVVYRDPEDGKGYCLFHAPAEHKEVSVDEFNEQVFKRIQVTTDLKDEEAICELGGTVFLGDISFSDRTLPRISFDSVQFTKRLFFQGAAFKGEVSFSAAHFGGVVYFTRATFEGFVDFTKASFMETTFFQEAIFNLGVDFSEVSFGGIVFFYGAVFKVYGLFPGTNFKTIVYYTSAVFDGEVDFNATIFETRAVFSMTTFGEEADFSFTEFWEEACFDSVTFRKTVNFTSIRIREKAILPFADCTIFSAPIIFKDCDPTSFLDLTQQYDLSNIHFINSPWEKNGRIKACTEDQEDKLQPTRDFYQRMKAKYKAENNEYEASKWHIAEKEAQRKLLKQNGESRGLRLGLSLYRWSSRFGEDPVLAGKWLVGLIALVWLFLGLGGMNDGQVLIQGPAWPNTWENVSNFGTVFMTLFKNVMLFKVVEFTPQYGLIGGIVLIMTRLVIPLQAALFAFALRNRFRR